MKISPSWLREFVVLTVDNRRLADDLTLAGIAIEAVHGEGDAAVFEMEITTNRPDAMNHYGVAREASALYDLPLKPLDAHLLASSSGSAFPIEIQDAVGCGRYTAQVIRGVSIKASPEAITKRLSAVDQRAVNNVADASNYTLWEMGHPTHAFDLDQLEGGKLIVRRATKGETLKTLDGVDRKLSTEDLIIADAKKPVALAGIMGGLDTMITDRTKNVLIESAWFDPASVRKASKRLGMHTDASHRFERGADYGATATACRLVTRRVLDAAGGSLDGGLLDVVGRKIDLAPVALRVSEVHRILGEKIGVNAIVRVLKRLGFDLLAEPGDDTEFTVSIPTWRLDVEREIDLIEEIARLHGYDKFANTLPAYTGAVIDLPEAGRDEILRGICLALGYDEAISLTFISDADAKRFSSMPILELENPLSAEASAMRTSMVPGMLNMLAYNLNRGSDDVRLFESGNVFQQAGTTAEQLKRICLGATGAADLASAHQPSRPLSFFDVKGDAEALLERFEHKTLVYELGAAGHYHPGRSAKALLDGEVVAEFGQIHPDIAAARKLKRDVFVAELYLDKLYRHNLRQPRYQPLSPYPAVERDFSFILADDVHFNHISKSIAELGIGELRQFVPVEIFRGGSVPAGKHSLLLRAQFQSNHRTLREEEVAEWSAKIAKALEGLGGTQRA